MARQGGVSRCGTGLAPLWGMTLSNDAERLPQRADDLDVLRDELEQADWFGTEPPRGRRRTPTGRAHRRAPRWAGYGR